MSVSFTAPAGQMRLAADIVTRSIERGDWDEDACDLLSPAVGAFSRAAGDVDDTEPVTAELSAYLADEMSDVLGSDVAAGGALHLLLQALDAALDAS